MRKEFESTIIELCEKSGGKKGISLHELSTGDTFEYNADWVLNHPASTIKLGVLCAALYKVQEGLISLSDKAEYLEKDKVPGSGVLQYLTPGTVLTLYDMLMLMIIQSDNTATNISIDHVGLDYINNFFQMCGLTDIRLNRKIFDMEGIGKGIKNFISARDLTRLLYDLEKRVYIKEEHAAIGLDILLKQQLTDLIPKQIKSYWDDDGVWYRYPIRVASKSGSDDRVLHDCGIIYTPKSTIILTVMTMGTYPPSASALINDVAKLAVEYFDPASLEKTFKSPIWR